MKKYRIGNNVAVKLTLTTDDGLPYELGSSVKLYASTPNQRFEVKDFSVDDNVIVWNFKGRDQEHLGPYRLTVVENEGGVDMMTVDFCNAFCLVACSCLADGDDGSGVETDSVDLESEISAEQIGLSPEVEEIVREAVADYGLLAVQLDMTTGKLAMTRGEKTQFAGGELNERGELTITYNY